MTTTADETYSTVEVSRLTGATYRQLDYWCRKGWIPGQSLGNGSGSRRRWSDEQITVAERLKRVSDQRRGDLAKALRDAG